MVKMQVEFRDSTILIHFPNCRFKLLKKCDMKNHVVVLKTFREIPPVL